MHDMVFLIFKDLFEASARKRKFIKWKPWMSGSAPLLTLRGVCLGFHACMLFPKQETLGFHACCTHDAFQNMSLQGFTNL